MSLRLSHRLSVALLLPMLAVVMPFLHAYANNVTNVQLPLATHAVGVAAIAAAAAFAVLLGLTLVPEPWRTRLALVVLYLSFACWFMTNFSIGEYAPFGGQEPDWAANRVAGLVEIAVLLAAAAALIRFRETVAANLTFLSALLIATSLVYLPSLWRRIEAAPPTGYVFSKEGVYDLSRGRNVILFVVDTLQADVAAEVLAARPGLAAAFEGFTFFRNALSPFPKTYGSLPAMLSGHAYDNSVRLRDYLRETYLKKSLLVRLGREGFDVRIWPFTVTPYFRHPAVADNVARGGGASGVAVWVDRSLLANLVLFRLAPQVAKPWVYNDGRFRFDFERRAGGAHCLLEPRDRRLSAKKAVFDAVTVDELLKCMAVTRREDVFRLYHFTGAHAPLQFNADFDYVGPQPITRERFRDQAAGILHGVAMVLGRMRELGIYNDALIVVAGDHGAGEYHIGINFDQPLLPPRAPRRNEDVRESIVRGGIPALLVKLPGAGNALSVSDAPVELTDIPATVMDALGGDATAFPGMPVQAVDPSAPRTRLHRHYRFTGWNVDYLVPMTEYAVEGFSWDPGSWRPSGRDLNSSAGEGGILVLMGEDRLPDGVEIEGWSRPSRGGRRIQGREARLELAHMPAPAVLTMVHAPYSSTGRDPLYLQLMAGDRQLAEFAFHSDDRQRRKHAVLAGGVPGNLRLVPGEEGSELRVTAFRIDPLERFDYRPGIRLDFVNGGDADHFAVSGWSEPGPFGTSALGHEAGLVFRITDADARSLTLRMALEVQVPSDEPPQRLQVEVNGEVLEDFTVEATRPVDLVLPVTAGAGGLLEVRLRFAQPVVELTGGRPRDSVYAAVLRRVVIAP